jgi:pyruvate kinase
MLRRTKIVATLGPACSDPKVLDKMLEAGVDVVRLNFSHGTAEEHQQRCELVRSLAKTRGRAVGVLVDLQGPKIRIGKFKDGKISLKPGDPFIFDATCKLGDQTRVGLDYPELVRDVARGATLLLDDGRIEMWVEEVKGDEVFCKVVQGGVLSNNKGINRKGGGLSAAALTEKDIEDIKTAAAIKADYLAVSFPRSAADIQQAREILRAAGGKAWIVAKIERAEAIEALDDILNASDAIMVARGDLGVEVGDAAVPALQKRMTRMAREKNKVVITATQMMESMIESPIPTRAEVSDVANAVLDGTDAVMLLAETAAGKYPVEAISAMHRVCLVLVRSRPASSARGWIHCSRIPEAAHRLMSAQASGAMPEPVLAMRIASRRLQSGVTESASLGIPRGTSTSLAHGGTTARLIAMVQAPRPSTAGRQDSSLQARSTPIAGSTSQAMCTSQRASRLGWA